MIKKLYWRFYNWVNGYKTAYCIIMENCYTVKGYEEIGHHRLRRDHVSGIVSAPIMYLQRSWYSKVLLL